MTSVTDVVVIGAGQSGLAATRALQARGISPVVLEAGPEPAGSWPHYYDISLSWAVSATEVAQIDVGETCDGGHQLGPGWWRWLRSAMGAPDWVRL
jgi:phytoene dehydrogenase-like protein